MNNPVNWFEIAAIDLERAKKCYEGIFQQKINQFIEMPGSKMYMFDGKDEWRGAMGALVESEENSPSSDGTIIYFLCKDVANEVSRVKASGGKVLFPKTSIGEFGFISQFIDTEGNRIGLHSTK